MAAAIAAMATLGAACTSDGSDEVVAAPSVLADAVEGVDSGRMESFGEDGTSLSVVEFEGANSRMTFSDAMRAEAVGEAGEEPGFDPLMSFPEEFLTVDGVTYQRSVGSDRWTSYEELPGFESSRGPESEQFSDFLAAATEVVVERPGERVERDGTTVTRYVAELRGTEADLLFNGSSDQTDASAGEPDSYTDEAFADEMDELYQRGERVEEYFSARTTYRFIGDIDDRGRLVRLEMAVEVDSSEYPDCEMYPAEATGRVVLTELGDPQGIVAPPADLVDAEPALDIDPTFEDDLAVPEDEPMLATATGPRPTWAVLEYLRSWAERQGIDWQSVPLPDDAQMVVLFDQFYAQDLAERGPAVSTVWGPYPRGYLVEVVLINADWLGLDPATVASLPDDELALRFEESGGIGTPMEDDALADGGAGAGGAVDEFVPAEDEGVDDELRAEYDEMYAGCPD